jgi:hypothetical protein
MMNEIHYKDVWGGIEEMYGEDKGRQKCNGQ